MEVLVLVVAYVLGAVLGFVVARILHYRLRVRRELMKLVGTVVKYTADNVEWLALWAGDWLQRVRKDFEEKRVEADAFVHICSLLSLLVGMNIIAFTLTYVEKGKLRREDAHRFARTLHKVFTEVSRLVSEAIVEMFVEKTGTPVHAF